MVLFDSAIDEALTVGIRDGALAGGGSDLLGSSA